MQNEHRKVKSSADKVTAVQSSEPVEGEKQTTTIRKVAIDFKKLTLLVLPSTLSDLQDIQTTTGYSMKQSVGFLCDLGSMAYKQLKVQLKAGAAGVLKQNENEEKKEEAPVSEERKEVVDGEG